MQFEEIPIEGAFLITPKIHTDSRGSFIRIFCKETLAEKGLESEMVQSNVSMNIQKHTLRGMHFQKSPFEEAKLVQCLSGHCLDVILDLRSHSPSFGHSYSIELSANDPHILYIPKGCAHGFLTLEPRTLLMYHMSTPYESQAASGIHWKSATLKVHWPSVDPIVSDQDDVWPNFQIDEWRSAP